MKLPDVLTLTANKLVDNFAAKTHVKQIGKLASTKLGFNPKKIHVTNTN